jgi:hypothetical protein
MLTCGCWEKNKIKWKGPIKRGVGLQARLQGSTCYFSGSAPALPVSFHASVAYWLCVREENTEQRNLQARLIVPEL